MFFTQELLARRDSGFGLLWLAATLGSKSSFKKLPRRSVLTADIAQLCGLIVQPAEPLALRLSSNLMFGVVRVYKVKQDILFTDATNTVTALKKVVLDATTKSTDAQLQMAQTSLRPGAVTIVPDARTAHILDYDAFVADWDEFLNIGDDAHANKKRGEDGSDSDEFDPTQAKKKSKSSAPKKKGPAEDVESLRGARDPHLLPDHNEHLLSASFDLSFSQILNERSGGAGVSSSQAEGFLDFDANPFQLSDGLDLGEEGFTLGDELAKELGWGSPAKSVARDNGDNRESDGMQFNFFDNPDNNAGNDFNFDVNMGNVDGEINDQRKSTTPAAGNPVVQTPASKMRKQNKENAYPRNTPGSVLSKRGASPANSFGRLFLSQDQDVRATPLRDITVENEQEVEVEKSKPTAKKRARLLLDARTELTDEELKVARSQYLEFQNELKRDMLKKKHERDGVKMIEDMMWGVPKEIQDPSLVDFWKANFKVQLEARSGTLSIHTEPEKPPRKRKRLSPIFEDDGPLDEQQQEKEDVFGGFGQEQGDVGMMMDFDAQPGGFFDEQNPFAGSQDNLRRGSSEEPGQARRASRPNSIFGDNDLAFDLGRGPEPGSAGSKNAGGSQRSSLFPWDNAGPSSSGGTGFHDDHPNVPIDHVEIKLRGSSVRSRRSSVAPSQTGAGGAGFSPIVQPGSPGLIDGNYEFNLGEQGPPAETQEDTQKTEVHLATLERNSYNFLEYAKMQYRTLPEGGQLTFNMVVPQDTSTRHVAAAAFYHCLVLATKDLLRLEQPTPYENVVLEIRHLA